LEPCPIRTLMARLYRTVIRSSCVAAVAGGPHRPSSKPPGRARLAGRSKARRASLPS
jgi:hypothetical protein